MLCVEEKANSVLSSRLILIMFVKEDMKEGTEAGVSGTPAFFVNGISISGAQPFEVFKAVIDAELEN